MLQVKSDTRVNQVLVRLFFYILSKTRCSLRRKSLAFSPTYRIAYTSLHLPYFLLSRFYLVLANA